MYTWISTQKVHRKEKKGKALYEDHLGPGFYEHILQTLGNIPSELGDQLTQLTASFFSALGQQMYQRDAFQTLI